MNQEINELTIPVPWGQINAKAWGDENNEIVLVFHGGLDNAGSFDNLIPLLPNTLYYICFDLPGHGKSTPLPPFFPLYSINYLIVYKVIVKYFKKQSYIFLAHSFGAVLSQTFSRLYPQHVKKLILLDGFILNPIEVPDEKEILLRTIDGVIEIHEKSMKGNKPNYTYKEALERFQYGRQYGTLSDQQIGLLFNRGLEPVGDGKYEFTVDQRLKILLYPLQDMEYALNGLRQNPVLCPVLVVIAKTTHPMFVGTRRYLEVVKTWKNAIIKFVDGGHDVHMTNPEKFATFITEFLSNRKCKM